MATEDAKADPAKTATARPERPNEEEYKTKLATAEKELKAAEERMKQIKSKIDNAQPKNKDSPSAKRQQELRTELGTIRTQQQSSKSGRTQVMDKIKRLDEQLKSRIAESKTARSKVQFKSTEDVQAQIDKLQKEVDSGSMKIVDEKKALSEISQLNRIKKGFAGFDESQKGIDDLKSQIADLKKSMDDPESKALSDRYTAITTELDKIKAEQDDAFKNLNALRDERTKIHEDQQKKYATVKEIKDAYYTQRRAAMDYEREARRVREEKRRAENDAYHRGRRQEAAKEKLEDASAPAYLDEIKVAQSLLAHFDPSSVSKQEAVGPGKYAATASRTVDASGIKGTALKKKGDDDDDNYFVGGGGKKKKGGKKGTTNGTASPAPEGKFQLNPVTIEYLARMNIDPPLSQADVPVVVEKLKEKVDFWKKDQDRTTKENIANAKAEIEKLEAEAAASSSATADRKQASADKQHVNGVADVAGDLEKTNLSDATSAAPAASTSSA